MEVLDATILVILFWMLIFIGGSLVIDDIKKRDYDWSYHANVLHIYSIIGASFFGIMTYIVFSFMPVTIGSIFSIVMGMLCGMIIGGIIEK